jgi:anti-sigma regulatory factor (Ser/Thr protein kinase)
LTTPDDPTQQPETPVVRVSISTDAELLPAVLEFVHDVAHGLGLEVEQAGRLRDATEPVCKNVLENAFEPGDDGSYEVQVLRRPGQVVVAVEDMGLPFDYARLRDSGGPDLLPTGGVRFINLGRHGNRVELAEHLPHADVRDHLPEEEHHEAVSAPAVPEDVPLEIREMRPEECFGLSRCVYRSYGYSYDWDDVYYPDRIKKLQEADLMRSCVAVTPEGEIVGHLAVTVEHPEASVGEAGQAVVHPGYRGHQLFPRMKTFMAERSAERGMCGLYSEATAVHPYSQKGNLGLGARETGFLIGYVPASVSYKEIGEDRAGSRGSVALFYMRTADEPERQIFPPAAYAEAVQRIVEHNGLRRVIGDGPNPGLAASRMSVEVRQDHNLGSIKVEEPGEDLVELVRLRLRELCLGRVDCVYADLPLSHPAAKHAAHGLQDLGFFFGGVIPEAHAAGGDILRLQYLNGVEIDSSTIKTASDFGRELLDLILRQKDAVER